MSAVLGQWNAEFAVNGREFLINPSIAPKLQWFQTIHQNLPSLNIEYHDVTGELAMLLREGDGMPIDITLGDGGSTGDNTSRFNIQGTPSISLQARKYVININAVLDAMPYTRKVASGLYKGTSTAALSKLAGEIGLSFSGDSTSDSQVWLPNNKTLAGFARNIAQHGWASSNSAMMLAVSDQFELLYKDIDQIVSGGASKTFDGYGKSGYPILDYSATSSGALANHNRALGSTSSGFDMEGTLKELTTVPLTMIAGFLNFGGNNKAALGDLGGRLDQIIRNAGNVHDKFFDAFHQNKRIRSLYSFDLNILSNTVSNAELLSKVYAQPLDPITGGVNSMLAGDYIVTGVTKTWDNRQYLERVTLTSTGPN